MRPPRANRPADFASVLQGGDRRSIGQADAVVQALAGASTRLPEAWACLRHSDPVVRMRAADALEKFSRHRADLLVDYKAELLSGELEDGTPAMRWHLIPMTVRLPLQRGEAAAFMDRLSAWLRHDSSRIVKVMALQAAWDVAARVPECQAQARAMRDFAAHSPWASVRARAKLLK